MPLKAQKLRTNLRLTINRLKLLERKKTEEAMKARREIGDYIKNKRIERARIRVEHIVREDYLVEAMEVVELYCDLLLARFGMLEQMAYCEESIAEAVATLIWVTPRLSADCPELKEISHQLENKFGKEFAQQARSNLSGTVNPKVIHRLGVEAPKKSLVENYLIEIARNYHTEYEPDPTAFLDDDALGVAAMGQKPFLPDEVDEPPLPHKAPEADRYATFPVAPPPAAQMPPNTHHFPPPGPPPSQPPGYNAGPPPYNGPPPPTNPDLPYPTGPQSGVQPPSLPVEPPNLDLPPVPSTSFPDTSTSDSGGGDVDFDDLTRRFEQLKKRK